MLPRHRWVSLRSTPSYEQVRCSAGGGGVRLWPLPVGHPEHALPVQHRQGLSGAVEGFAAGLAGVVAVAVAQGRDHFLGDPLADAAVFRVEVVDQRGVYGGFAEQQFVLVVAIAAAQPGAAVLVVVQVAQHALFQHRHAHQPAEVAGAEPALVFQQQGAQLALVAGEQGGDQYLFRHGAPPGWRGKRAGTAERLRAEGWG